ncbi:MAG: bifunctional diaminohydroxyphosphoribosylaminopyrimidine deaminase/5-amino-6-(5-phosphoribosylamino)uracil reductase RibD [Bacteroidota bacterium]
MHEKYILRCLELAKNGLGLVQPNPMVGCVIIHDNKIIGEGYHRQFGQAHAEVNAINNVKDKSLLKNSVLYVNLEPCAHYGKTPPCAELIVRMGIPKVIIGTIDPFDKVMGKGIKILTKGGCKVKTGILEKECRELNKRFFTFHEKRRPYIILKWAETQDGFVDIIRLNNQKNRPTWISNETCRISVHKWRSEEQAILVGTETARIDNPMLNVRTWKGKNPLRIVIDKDLVLPNNLHLFDQSQPTLILTKKEQQSLRNMTYKTLNFDEDIIDQLMNYLFEIQIQSLIVEGGVKTLQHFIDNNIWDEARIFTGNMNFHKGIKAPEISGNISEKTTIGDSSLTIIKKLF